MNAEEIETRRPEGRPPHAPTQAQRQNVETLSGYGLPQEDIAAFIGVAVETLMKHYPDEMKLGRVKADAKVAGSLFKKAISDDHPQATNAAIWWEKTRSGRRDKQDIEANVNGRVEHAADESFAAVIAALDIAGRVKASSSGRAGEMDSDGAPGATSA